MTVEGIQPIVDQNLELRAVYLPVADDYDPESCVNA
jgi:hypothetical protein